MGQAFLDYILFLIVQKQTTDIFDLLIECLFLSLYPMRGEGIVLRNCASIFCFEGVSTNENKLLTVRNTSKFYSFNKDNINR